MTLMSMVVVLCLALLALAVGVRSGARSQRDETEARCTARLALALALGQLQAQMGPDQRVSVAADQLAAESSPGTTTAAPTRRWWTGVYDSWPAEQDERPRPQFRRWLVSGDPQVLAERETAMASGPVGTPAEGRPSEIRLVAPAQGAGAEKSGEVRVPVVAAGTTASLAWWSGDENLKALVVERTEKRDESPEAVRGRLAAAPRQAVELAESSPGVRPLQGMRPGDPRGARLVDWPQTALVAEPAAACAPLFHDLTTRSTGLMTNVRRGGFRRDLSLYLEKPYASRPKDVLYTAGGDTGINLEELWAYYHIDKQLKSGGLPAFTTGGTAPDNAFWLQAARDPTAATTDDYFHFKQPALVSIQALLSLYAETAAAVGGQNRYKLYLVFDPILTYWNPLDVPVAMPVTGYNSIKYWALTYNLRVWAGGVLQADVPIGSLMTSSDHTVMAVRPGRIQAITLRPGEVLMVSQAASTPVQLATGNSRLVVDCTAGFNFGGGIGYPVDGGTLQSLADTEVIKYEIVPNQWTQGGPGQGGSHTSYFSLYHHEWYVGEDRGQLPVSLGFGNLCVDWGFGNTRLGPGELRPMNAAATKSPRLLATSYPQVFKGVPASQARPLTVKQLFRNKEPVFLYSYNLKTENGAARPGRYFARFNRNALHNDFYDLTEAELEAVPFEVQAEALDSWKSPNIELSPNGNGYLGGGRSAYDGVSQIVTHSVPRAPVLSLGALQHSLANGFTFLRPKAGYASLNAREPLLPQISHAIGNSLATPILGPSQTEGSLASSRRPVADHSYLANRALFDDWFLSGIAPQVAPLFGEKRAQARVARDFLEGRKPLPNAHYRLRLGKEDAAAVLALLFRGETPTADAADRIAAYLSVEGMFNVNSTSVEAWKAMLGGLKGQSFVVQEAAGGDALGRKQGNTVVAGLQTPVDMPVDAGNLGDVKEPAQWLGYRVLTDDDLAALARAIVREVRRRGPFLSLADFVNRRVGKDSALARSGAIQAALDSTEVPINGPLLEGSRRAPAAKALPFGEAEAGPAGYGMPGCVKQADILTPIAPVLSARSDTFRLRAYGERTAPDGRVLSRAWCEAVVEREADYVDPADPTQERDQDLVEVNRTFGRKFRVVSFRWLSPEEV